jgi:LPS-assembly protein
MQPNSMQIDRHRIFRARVSLWIALVFLSFSALPFECHAEGAVGQNTNWEITADQITYNQVTNAYTAEGDVRISRQGRILTADKARLDQTTHLAWAEGNVRLLSGQDTLTGRRLELNLENETGTLSDGKLFLAQNHMYVNGKLILKTGPQTYFAKDASVTTCDGPKPDWHITGKDLKVTIQGYGFVKHAAFWADGIPLMYTPFLFFPVKLKRQSGLLTPDFSFSDRKGFDYLQPFFWAINDNTDATLFSDYMTERGLRLGAEYRYVASEHSMGTFMLDGFHDRQIDDGQGNNSQRWGYTGDASLRTNRDRYWLRGKANQDLPWKMTAKADVDLVSDQDYLQDFKNGFNGFEQTRAYFLRTFGRNIDDYTETIRQNQLNINRLWTSYTFNTNVRWFQDAVHDGPPDTLTPLQDLPEITLDGIKQKIDGSPLYYSLATSYINFYHETGDRGQRADVNPRVYYPTRFFNAVSVEPSAGIRQTEWHVDHYETAPADDKRDFNRTLYDLSLNTSMDFDRVYPIATAGCDRLKHDIRPQIIYTYIPNVDQGNDPNFDALDRIDGQNLVTFALTNTLIARKPSTVPSLGPEAEYIPFLRFRLEESFDINKYKDDDPRPFTDIDGELEIRPGRYVLLNGDFLWRPYNSEFYGYNLALNLFDLRGDRLSLDYRFTRETEEFLPVKSINVSGALRVTQRWALRGSYESDLENNQFIASGAGVSYISQCWGVDLDYTRDEQNNIGIAFRVHLIGLGSIGG